MTANIWASARLKRHGILCECGVEFISSAPQAKWCATCKPIKQAEQRAAAYERRDTVKHGNDSTLTNFDNRQFEVVYDPDGDFSKGSRLGVLDLQYTLELGYLPVGMRLRDVKRGVVSVVVAGQGGFELSNRAVGGAAQISPQKRWALNAMRTGWRLVCMHRRWKLTAPLRVDMQVNARLAKSLLAHRLIECDGVPGTNNFYKLTAAGQQAAGVTNGH